VSEEIIAAVGIGSNLDDPSAQVVSGLRALGNLPESRLLRQSALYTTPPMGPPDQPDYVNAVALIATLLPPLALLDALQAIERAHHRVRERHWGPRTLDLDLLCYGDVVLSHPRLVLPHPGISERAFVVIPLLEIAPELGIPGLPSLARMAAALAAHAIRRVEGTSPA
jgi:2-amino-4-hydroxy-6-hydroxymethyldihydropteridine diphosphokinase